MEMILAIVLGLLALALGGAAAWMWKGKSGAFAQAAGLEARLTETRHALENEHQRAGELHDRLQEKIEGLLVQTSAAQSVQDKLEEQISSVRREAETRIEALTNQHKIQLASVHAQQETELGNARKLHAQQVTQLEEERARFEAQARELKEQLTEAFERLSGKVLQDAQERLVKTAKEQFTMQQKEDEAELDKRKTAVEQMIKPIDETLKATRTKLDEIEKTRAEHYAQLAERMESMTKAGTRLGDETSKLSKALSKPEIRGQYGEIQLKRVAELAGMTAYCDFTEQASTRDSEGKALRPDMVVQLPNDRLIAVDAKANINAYLEALEAENEDDRKVCLDRFARHVKEQIKSLGSKSYWSLFEHSPVFVVMFVPGDQYVDAALARTPDLIDFAAQNNVILASPSTLIGLLRAVAVGWREQALTEQADDLLQLGMELHERAAKVFEHAAKLGKSIGQSVSRYNALVGSIDSRMRPTLERFEQTGVKSSKTLEQTPQIGVTTQYLQALPVGSKDEPNSVE